MTYMEFIEDYIKGIEYGNPIYTEDIVPEMAREYSLEDNKAAAAVSVAVKRIMDSESLPELRKYQKGIYYRTKPTIFGDVEIDTGKLIDRKYISPDKGYETGAGLFYRMGLTTHIPAMRYIATNVIRVGTRYDEKLEVTICPPKTTVTAENKRYLRVLDVLYQMDDIPYDAEHPYDIISGYVERCNLNYEMLLSYADMFYNQKTVIRLGHLAANKERRYVAS